MSVCLRGMGGAGGFRTIHLQFNTGSVHFTDSS